MIITKTPFRVSLFGGGTDIPSWYLENGGSVLSFAINKYCYLTTRILPPFFDHKYRVAYSLVETVANARQIMHPVVRECILKYASELNLEIHHDGDLPARSGVGSSSAFTVGLIHALHTLQNRDITNIELANQAIDMEQNVLRENVGSQDQIACALGGINFIEFGPGDFWKHQEIKMAKETLDEFQNRLVLIYTGLGRNSSEINAELFQNIDLKSRYFRRLMELSISCREILLKSDDLDQIGKMLDESWKLKQALNSNSSNSNLNDLYQKALKAGALGGKILGAGGGGFFLFCVGKDKRNDFLSNFRFGVNVPVEISYSGSTVVYRGGI